VIEDPLDDLKIETDLKRKLLADIQHQRIVGSYKGKRYVWKAVLYFGIEADKFGCVESRRVSL
jgi:hypothetical protein